MAYDDSNIFAKILRGEIPNKTVLDEKHVLAFHDVSPKAPVHILVIPKGNYIEIADFSANASDEEKAALFTSINMIVEEFDLKEEGFRCIANTGINGGQEVPHFHIHIMGGRHMGPMVLEED